MTESELRERLSGKKANKKQDPIFQNYDVPQTKSNSWMMWPILVLALLLFYIVNDKLKYDDVSPKAQIPDASNTAPDLHGSQDGFRYRQYPHEEIMRMRAEFVSLKTKDAELAEQISKNKELISLLGIVQNNNFVIEKNDYDKRHLVFFNSDWTINQMPRYIELSPEDKEYLDKFVRK